MRLNSIQDKHQRIATLTMEAGIKAVFVFASTIALYYIAKVTEFFSCFSWKSSEVQNLGGRQLLEVKNGEVSVELQNSIEKVERANTLSTTHNTQLNQNDILVEFEKVQVESLPERRSISVQNPISDQSATAGQFFEMTINGTSVFSNDSAIVSIEVISAPEWLSSSSSPTLIGLCEMPDFANNIVLVEDYVFVAAWEGGLQIVDVSDKSDPTIIGSYDTPVIASGVAVSGDYAYIAAHLSGLQIVDISNLYEPTLKGSYGVTDDDRALRVAVSDNYVYLTVGDSGMKIVDVTNPSSPTLVSSYHTGSYTKGIEILGNNVYLASGYSGLRILDVTDKEDPVLIGSYESLDYVSTLTIFDNYAYLVDARISDVPLNTIHIVDISGTSNIMHISSIVRPDIYDVSISDDDYAYLSNGFGGLELVDIADISNPTHKFLYDTNGFTYEVIITDSYVYLADGDSDRDSGLKIISRAFDQLFLSGTSDSKGIYNVVIQACNVFEDCVSDSFNILVENNAPIVAIPLEDQEAVVGNLFRYIFPEGTFVDPDGNTLTYTAEPLNDTSLPGWLSVYYYEGGFFGKPDAVGTHNIRVIAHDGYGGNISDAFAIHVREGLDVNSIIIACSVAGAVVCVTGVCCLTAISVGLAFRKKKERDGLDSIELSDNTSSSASDSADQLSIRKQKKIISTESEEEKSEETEEIYSSSSSDNVEYDEEPPEDLCCPISAGLMEDPVMVVESGQTYDRESIETWFEDHDTDPLIGKRVANKRLVVNYAIKRLVEEWMEDHKK